MVIWDRATGHVVLAASEFGDIIRLEFTHDDKCLLYGRVYTLGDSVDDDVVRLVNATNGRFFNCSDRNYVGAASPTTDQIVVANGVEALAYALSGYPKSRQAEVRVDLKDAYPAKCLAFDPDGSVFVAMYRVIERMNQSNGSIGADAMPIRHHGLAIIDASSLTPRQVSLSDDLATCTALDVSRGSRLIATGHSNGRVGIWDGSLLVKMREINIGTNGAVCPVFSPSGKELAILTQPANRPIWNYAKTPSGFNFGRKQDDATCQIVLYDTSTFRVTNRMVFQDGRFDTVHANGHMASLNPRRLAYSPDGENLLIGCNGVTLLDAKTGKVISYFDVAQEAQ